MKWGQGPIRRRKDCGRARSAGMGCLLVVLGILCLIFGWPWGALVGAILILAGVILHK